MSKRFKSGLVVWSGGLDSTTLLWEARTECELVETVHFQYGSKHNPMEWGAVQRMAKYHGIKVTRINLNFIGKHFDSALLTSGEEIPEGHYEDISMRRTVVPFRNGIMISIAVGLAESHNDEVVYLGAHSGDHAIYPDCRPEFLSAMRASAYFGTYNRVYLCTPFTDMDKGDIVKAGESLGVPFGETWTCYKGGPVHCGRCGACQERIEAFEKSGVRDQTEYQIFNKRGN